MNSSTQEPIVSDAMYPWIAGASAPILGIQLAVHLATGAPVCFDPLSAKEANAATAADCMLNRFSKSSQLRQGTLVHSPTGVKVLCPGDPMPDLRKLAEAVEGQVTSSCGRPSVTASMGGGVSPPASMTIPSWLSN